MEITEDTINATWNDYSLEHTETCTGAVGEEGGISLWQFVMDDGTDGMFTSTKNTRCRHGANAATPPACPWNRCGNDECTECLEDD